MHSVKAAIRLDEDKYVSGWMCHRTWKVISRAACIACTHRCEAEGCRDLKEHPRMVPSTAQPLEGERTLRLKGLPPARKILK